MKEFVYGTLIATRDEDMSTAELGQADEEAYELSRFLTFVERVDDEHLLGIEADGALDVAVDLEGRAGRFARLDLISDATELVVPGGGRMPQKLHK